MKTTTFSYWEKTSFTAYADVIIVGSGLVGLSAALHLKKAHPSLNITVVEGGFLPTGASTKNAGFACFGSVSEQLASIAKSSEEELLRMVDYKWRGLQKLRQNLGDGAINYIQYGGYELFKNDQQQEADYCISQISRLNQLLGQVIVGEPIYSEANEHISAFGFHNVCKMIYNPFEGQIDTGKMMRALLTKVYSSGILVLNNCIVGKIDHADTGVNMLTNHGLFKAGKVILATNGFASKLYPELEVTPGRGQVLVTKPIPGLKIKGTFHFDEGYYYFRNIDGRVLFGGGRNLDFAAETTWEFGHTEKVKEILTNYLTEMILPGTNFEIDYWWSGIMGFGETSPIIKEVEPNVYCAVRCNGMGVAMGSLVGEEVAELAYPSH